MRFSEGHIKVDSFLRNITCERRDLISGVNLFHSLMLKCEKEFLNRSVLNILPCKQTGLRWESWIGGIGSWR